MHRSDAGVIWNNMCMLLLCPRCTPLTPTWSPHAQFQEQPAGMSQSSYVWDVNNPNTPEYEMRPTSQICATKFNLKASAAKHRWYAARCFAARCFAARCTLIPRWFRWMEGAGLLLLLPSSTPHFHVPSRRTKTWWAPGSTTASSPTLTCARATARWTPRLLISPTGGQGRAPGTASHKCCALWMQGISAKMAACCLAQQAGEAL